MSTHAGNLPGSQFHPVYGTFRNAVGEYLLRGVLRRRQRRRRTDCVRRRPLRPCAVFPHRESKDWSFVKEDMVDQSSSSTRGDEHCVIVVSILNIVIIGVVIVIKFPFLFVAAT